MHPVKDLLRSEDATIAFRAVQSACRKRRPSFPCPCSLVPVRFSLLLGDLLRLLPPLWPPVRLENFLAQAQRLGRDFYQLIVGDELDALLQI